MKYLKIKLILLFLLIGITSCKQDKRKLFIIGDSISIGYTPFVTENLKNIAEVSHNPGNAQHTGTGLSNIETWIEANDWDIIQFNWGLWDLCYRHPDSKVQGHRDKKNGTITYSLHDYASNLDSIVTILKTKTNAKLIFVTTTYVPENEAGRFQNDVIRYNEAAKKIMKKHSIMVNDIYEQSILIHKKFGKGLDDVHYSKEGYEKLSEHVTEFLKTEIK
ncbi:SGNH/GDSL hydrolase family protein [Gaetbulibacter sp. M240]|uniref:SGNH/GDSL hydrolase family protein n=1 Tax=Gaetbulibacter sp. M240 TaxID=3126511 RepID=UPI00374E58D9